MIRHTNSKWLHPIAFSKPPQNEKKRHKIIVWYNSCGDIGRHAQEIRSLILFRRDNKTATVNDVTAAAVFYGIYDGRGAISSPSLRRILLNCSFAHIIIIIIIRRDRPPPMPLLTTDRGREPQLNKSNYTSMLWYKYIINTYVRITYKCIIATIIVVFTLKNATNKYLISRVTVILYWDILWLHKIRFRGPDFRYYCFYPCFLIIKRLILKINTVDYYIIIS